MPWLRRGMRISVPVAPNGLLSRSCDMQKNKCINCLPLQPFDPSVLQGADPPIKFLSFHAYLRKLRTGVDKGRLVLPWTQPA